jgi:hypothetical protein
MFPNPFPSGMKMTPEVAPLGPFPLVAGTVCGDSVWGQDSNLRPLGYELTGRGLPLYAGSHISRSATFNRPTCLATSRLFASVPPCSVAKSVATTPSAKRSRLGRQQCKAGSPSSGSTRVREAITPVRGQARTASQTGQRGTARKGIRERVPCRRRWESSPGCGRRSWPLNVQ